MALALRQLPAGKIRDWGAAIVLTIGLMDGTVLYLMTVGRYFG